MVRTWVIDGIMLPPSDDWQAMPKGTRVRLDFIAHTEQGLTKCFKAEPIIITRPNETPKLIQGNLPTQEDFKLNERYRETTDSETIDITRESIYTDIYSLNRNEAYILPSISNPRTDNTPTPQPKYFKFTPQSSLD
jgi:hypothetical protein